MPIVCTGVVNFNHLNGCQKCLVQGKYSKISHRTYFPHYDCQPRTNQSFRQRNQPQHHNKLSPLEDLEIDMIKDFPTSDPLHLLELGVMKR